MTTELLHPPETHRLGKKDAKAPHAMLEEFVDFEKAQATVEVPANIINSALTDGGPAEAIALAMYLNDDEGDCTCFPPGTRIRMGDGTTRPIEELKPLDTVLSAEGRPRAVMSVMTRRTTSLLRVAAWGACLRMTAEHPVLTRRGYVAAKNLTRDDWLALPRWRPAIDAVIYPEQYVVTDRRIRTTGYRRWGGSDVVVRLCPLPERVPLEAEFGELMGLFLAEGSTNQNAVRLTFGGHERETLVPRAVELIDTVLGAEARARTRPNGTVDVVLCGKHWRMFFEALSSKGVYNKAIHPDLWRGSDEFLEAMLRGWLAGDGHHRRDNTVGTSTSHALALGMFDIAQHLGLAPTISGRQPKMTTTKAAAYRWDVGIRDAIRAPAARQPIETMAGRFQVYQSYESRNRYVGTYDTREEADMALAVYREEHGIDSDGKSVVEDGVTWRKVRGVEEEDYDGWVFNLSVEEDESYVAEGIGVHNCAGAGNKLRVDSDDEEEVTDDDVQTVYVGVTGEEGAAYDPATGANDNGCVEIDVLDWITQNGIGGVKILGHAGVTPTDDKQRRMALYLTGALYSGEQLSTDQQTQPIWEPGPAAPGSWGGHCTVHIDEYTELPSGLVIGGVPIPSDIPGGFVFAVGTWGAYKPCAGTYIKFAYDELHAILTQQWLDRVTADPVLSQIVDVTRIEAFFKTLEPES